MKKFVFIFAILLNLIPSVKEGSITILNTSVNAQSVAEEKEATDEVCVTKSKETDTRPDGSVWERECEGGVDCVTNQPTDNWDCGIWVMVSDPTDPCTLDPNAPGCETDEDGEEPLCDPYYPGSECYIGPPCDPNDPSNWCYDGPTCDPHNPYGGCYIDPSCDPNDPYGRCYEDNLEFTDPNEVFFSDDPNIDLHKLFNCFKQVPDNGASYKIKLCADIPVNKRPNALVDDDRNVGHTFITLTKSNGNASVTQSFGFYPLIGKLAFPFLPTPSKMNDNTNHEYDASIETTISLAQFLLVQSRALSKASKDYDLNDYNCTDYAVDIFNGASPNNLIVIPDWHGAGTGFNYGTTPNGLYYKLKELSSNPQVHFDTSNAPAGRGLCQ